MVAATRKAVSMERAAMRALESRAIDDILKNASTAPSANGDADVPDESLRQICSYLDKVREPLQSLDHDRLQRIFKCLQAWSFSPVPMQSLLRLGVVRILANVYTCFIQSDYSRSEVIVSMLELLFLLEDMSEDTEGKTQCGRFFLTPLLALVTVLLPSIKLHRAAVETICVLITESPKNQQIVLDQKTDCQNLFTVFLPNCGDFQAQAGMMEIFFRLVNREPQLLELIQDKLVRNEIESLMHSKKLDLLSEIGTIVMLLNSSLGSSRSVYSFLAKDIIVNGDKLTISEKWVNFGKAQLSFYYSGTPNSEQEPDDDASIMDVAYDNIIEMKQSSGFLTIQERPGPFTGQAMSLDNGGSDVNHIQMDFTPRDLTAIETIVFSKIYARFDEMRSDGVARGGVNTSTSKGPTDECRFCKSSTGIALPLAKKVEKRNRQDCLVSEFTARVDDGLPGMPSNARNGKRKAQTLQRTTQSGHTVSPGTAHQPTVDGKRKAQTLQRTTQSGHTVSPGTAHQPTVVDNRNITDALKSILDQSASSPGPISETRREDGAAPPSKEIRQEEGGAPSPSNQTADGERGRITSHNSPEAASKNPITSKQCDTHAPETSQPPDAAKSTASEGVDPQKQCDTHAPESSQPSDAAKSTASEGVDPQTRAEQVSMPGSLGRQSSALNGAIEPPEELEKPGSREPSCEAPSLVTGPLPPSVDKDEREIPVATRDAELSAEKVYTRQRIRGSETDAEHQKVLPIVVADSYPAPLCSRPADTALVPYVADQHESICSCAEPSCSGNHLKVVPESGGEIEASGNARPKRLRKSISYREPDTDTDESGSPRLPLKEKVSGAALCVAGQATAAILKTSEDATVLAVNIDASAAKEQEVNIPRPVCQGNELMVLDHSERPELASTLMLAETTSKTIGSAVMREEDQGQMIDSNGCGLGAAGPEVDPKLGEAAVASSSATVEVQSLTTPRRMRTKQEARMRRSMGKQWSCNSDEIRSATPITPPVCSTPYGANLPPTPAATQQHAVQLQRRSESNSDPEELFGSANCQLRVMETLASTELPGSEMEDGGPRSESTSGLGTNESLQERLQQKVKVLEIGDVGKILSDTAQLVHNELKSAEERIRREKTVFMKICKRKFAHLERNLLEQNKRMRTVCEEFLQKHMEQQEKLCAEINETEKELSALAEQEAREQIGMLSKVEEACARHFTAADQRVLQVEQISTATHKC